MSYWDASALGKLYVPEPDSPALENFQLPSEFLPKQYPHACQAPCNCEFTGTTSSSVIVACC